ARLTATRQLPEPVADPVVKYPIATAVGRRGVAVRSDSSTWVSTVLWGSRSSAYVASGTGARGPLPSPGPDAGGPPPNPGAPSGATGSPEAWRNSTRSRITYCAIQSDPNVPTLATSAAIVRAPTPSPLADAHATAVRTATVDNAKPAKASAPKGRTSETIERS